MRTCWIAVRRQGPDCDKPNAEPPPSTSKTCLTLCRVNCASEKVIILCHTYSTCEDSPKLAGARCGDSTARRKAHTNSGSAG